MKREFNISESASECRLWWRKEGFSHDDNLIGDLDMTLYETGLARITGTVLYE